MRTRLLKSWAGLKVLISAAVLLAMPVLSVNTVSAYAGGDGSSGNPHLITNCTDLQNMSNDLDGYYKLMANIDCSATSSWNSGAGFVPVGTSGAPFTGRLEGQNFTIDGLTINRPAVDYQGLFGYGDGTWVTDVQFTDISVAGKLYVGGLFGYGEALMVRNDHVAGVIDGNYTYVGGLIGKGSESFIEKSSFSGTITAEEVGGGLAGMLDGVSNVSNSYATGTMTSTNDVCGGLFGIFYNGTITKSYSAMTMNFGTVGSCGGIVGAIDGVSLTSSFSDSVLNHTDMNTHGGAIGQILSSTYGASGVTDVYYNEYTCDCANGRGPGSSGSPPADTTTAVNVANATPDYFKNNSTNAPMDDWNFSTIWQTTASHPTLRIPAAPTDADGDGVSGAVEAAAPNNGDANNDNLPDEAQANVTSLVNPVTGGYISVEAPTCSSVTSVGVTAESTSSVDASYDYPMGIVSFQLNGCTVGGTENVSIYYHGDFQTNDLTLRKFNQSTGLYTEITAAGTTVGSFGGESVLFVTYSIQDGGPFDEDGVANGTIVDPVGLAVPAGASGTLADTGEDSQFITATGALLVIAGAAVLLRKRAQKIS